MSRHPCRECQHFPSARTGRGESCGCPCHDLADGSPTMLAALKKIILLPHNQPVGDRLHNHCPRCIAERAVRTVEDPR